MIGKGLSNRTIALTGAVLLATGVWLARSTAEPVFNAFLCALLATVLTILLRINRVVVARFNDVHEDIQSFELRTIRHTQSLLQLFQSIRPRHPLPLLGDYAIRPDFAAMLAALILELRPGLIVELGSGASTIISAYALESNGGGRIISLDHEREYSATTQREIERHKLAGFGEVVHSPLVDQTVAGHTFRWYDVQNLTGLEAINVLIVDGPPATTGPLARYPAVPLLLNRLAPNAVIVVDDANRPDEKEMVRRWMEEVPGLSNLESAGNPGTVVLWRA